ncbi:MAG: ARPP-1 family domain-containing protein [Candidatus Thorarchaeota archaeon]
MSSTDAMKHVGTFASEILGNTAFGLESPISYSGVSLVPIVLTEETQDAQYLNAAEALKKGTLEITEAGDAVDSILARNTGDVPVLIEEAEVLVADGSQDRIVVATVILQPGEESRIPVKCVHAPHALRRGVEFSSIGSGSVPLKAGMRRMKYQSIMTDVEHYAPAAAVDQSEVWSEVERYCRSLGIKDTTKYTDAMAKIQKKARKMAKDVSSSLPENACGFIMVDTNGDVVALEFYRNSRSFNQRNGVLESLLVEYCDTKKKPSPKEAAWAEAIQLLLHLKEPKQDQVVSRERSDNIVIGLHGLKGEAVVGETGKDTPKLLYCSLGK